MPKDSQMTVRLMAPFTMSCNTCGEFICEYPFVLCEASLM